MPVIQILIVAFVLFALTRAVQRFRARDMSLGWLIGWTVLWLGAGTAAVLPWTTEWLARLVGVGRGVDAVIYISIFFLFYLVFRIFLRLEKLEREITTIVRRLGLEEVEKEKEGATHGPTGD